jgi:hypothetical protein
MVRENFSNIQLQEWSIPHRTFGKNIAPKALRGDTSNRAFDIKATRSIQPVHLESSV